MRRHLTILLVMIMVVSIFAGCSGGVTSEKDTLNLSLRADIGSLHPSEATSESDTIVQQAIFMDLFYMSIETNEIRSEALKEWEVADDAMEYTFKLKEGIQFHNGEELKASDVVFSVTLAQQSPAQMGWSLMIDRAEVVSEYVVKIIMKAPNATFLQVANLTLLHEQTTVEAGEAFRDNPIGCGPYQFVSYQPGYRLTLKAFEGYSGNQPAFENVIYSINSDPSAAIIAAETGEIDFLMSTAFSQYESLRTHADLGVTTFDYGVDYLVMDNTVAPYDNPKVRLAINYAMDKQRFSDVYTEGLAQFPTSYIASVKSNELKGYPYNVELAKQYLAEAGYPDGQGFPQIKIETIDAYRTYAQVLQSNLQDIGIQADIAIAEPTAFVTDLMTGKVPFAVIGIGLGIDPSVYSDLLVSTGAFNLARYSNPSVDELFAQAKAEVDDQRRHDLYVELLQIAQGDAAYGIIANQLLMYVYNDKDLDFSYALENRSKSYIRPQDVLPR